MASKLELELGGCLYRAQERANFIEDVFKKCPNMKVSFFDSGGELRSINVDESIVYLSQRAIHDYYGQLIRLGDGIAAAHIVFEVNKQHERS